LTSSTSITIRVKLRFCYLVSPSRTRTTTIASCSVDTPLSTTFYSKLWRTFAYCNETKRESNSLNVNFLWHHV